MIICKFRLLQTNLWLSNIYLDDLLNLKYIDIPLKLSDKKEDIIAVLGIFSNNITTYETTNNP